MSIKDWIKNKLGAAMNPSVANVYAEYIDTSGRLELLTKQIDPQQKEQNDIVTQCQKKVVELKKNIDNRQMSAAWRLLHRIQEDMLLLIPTAEMPAEGQRTIQSMQLSALSETVKKDWIAKVGEAITKLENNGRYEEMKARQIIKMAANVINDYTDDSFWDIWAKRWMSFIYVAMLVLLLMIMGIRFNNALISPTAQISLGLVVLLGALGGYASGIWGSSQEYFAKGYFWINTFYYALVRPVAGILAAIVMLWLLMGQSYIKVDPPLSPCQIAPPMVAYGDRKIVSKGTPTCPMLETTPTSTAVNCPCSDLVSAASTTSESKDALITFKTPKGMAIYTYMFLLLVAGFAGDRLLKGVTDKVMTKLFAEAEKTKDAGKSSA